MDNWPKLEEFAAELEAWCKEHDYEYISADEIDPRNSEDAAWLEDFIKRWDAV